MTDKGWIKLHRQLIDWEWYSDINVRVLFIHCLLSANHEDKRWRGIEIKKGQFITSLEHLAIEIGLTVSQIRTAINKLKLTNEIAYKTTSQYSIITIKKWNEYQANDMQNNKPVTNEQQTDDKPIATNKNDKNDKNDKEILLKDENFKKIDAYFSQEVNEFIKVYKQYNHNCTILNQTRQKIARAIETNGLDVMLEVIKKSANKGHKIDNEFKALSLDNMLDNAQKILDNSYNLVDRQFNGILTEQTTDEEVYNMIYGDL